MEPGQYLQYGALGVVFFQTILFLILGKTILAGMSANRKAYESLAEITFRSFNETLGKVVDVIVKNAEAMSQLVDSQKDLQSSFLQSVKHLEDDHRALQQEFHKIYSRPSVPPCASEEVEHDNSK